MTKKKRVDLDVRPEAFFRNYDYAGPEHGNATSPGTGLYFGKMDKYKSVKDFIEKSRKRRQKRRKEALEAILKSIDGSTNKTA